MAFLGRHGRAIRTEDPEGDCGKVTQASGSHANLTPLRQPALGSDSHVWEAAPGIARTNPVVVGVDWLFYDHCDGPRGSAAARHSFQTETPSMTTFVAIVVANTLGIAALVITPLLFTRTSADWRIALGTRSGHGLLSLFAGGCLLVVGGQLLLLRLLAHVPARAAETQSRLQMALLSPLEGLTVEVEGNDPFSDRMGKNLLRLVAHCNSGAELVSELPSRRMSTALEVGRESPGSRVGRPSRYVAEWPSVSECATTETGRALAARVSQLNDLRRFDSLKVAIVASSAGRNVMPEVVRLATVSDRPVELFNGRRTVQKWEQAGKLSVWEYEEHYPIALQARLTGWKAEEPYRTSSAL